MQEDKADNTGKNKRKNTETNTDNDTEARTESDPAADKEKSFDRGSRNAASGSGNQAPESGNITHIHGGPASGYGNLNSESGDAAREFGDVFTDPGEVRTGLEPADTEYASHPSMSGGIDDEDEMMDRAVRSEMRKRAAAGFAAGVLFCMALLLVLTYAFGVCRILPGDKFKYYSELDDAFGKYQKIFSMIGNDPLVEKTPEELSDETLKELVSSLGDPYAEYFTADEYERFLEIYEGEFTGIGVSVTEEEEGIVIRAVIEGGPAGEAGAEIGDIIVAVDGTKPENINDAIELIRGKAGTEVTITLKRGNKFFDLTMKRDVIEQDSVEYDVTEEDPHIGYIRISSFHKDTSGEFETAVRDLKGQGCTGFIIDLRGNGGGLTDESVKIADYLLPECRIMTEVRKDGSEKVFNSKASSADIDYVILTDGNTASASEILAGAVQDNRGGLIIGTTTYGKGVTQATRKFRDGSAVKLTDTEYLRPDGGKVNGVGITPDIKAEGSKAMDAALKELSK